MSTSEAALSPTRSGAAAFCAATELPSPIGPLKRFCFALLAGVFFVVGLVGVVLPGLPTTPFLLLTSYFLVRSSPRLNDRLLRARFFGPILADWQHRGGVQTHVKIKAIALVIGAVGAAVYFTGWSLPLTPISLGLAGAGLVVIVRLPTLKSV
ncbi:MAG: YbaN family protein [Planctomycetales bacterium]|nr:YbaN family protein [Planctomycetales bacterium]